MAEIWDVYDIHKNKKNKLHKRGLPLDKNDYHIVIHAWVVNSNDEVILTKRHSSKKICPNMWECTEGSIVAGESSVDGAIRELKEEIGLNFKIADAKFFASFVLDFSNTIIDSYVFKRDVNINDLVLQENEVSEAKIVDERVYREMCKNGEVVESLMYFYDLYKK